MIWFHLTPTSVNLDCKTCVQIFFELDYQNWGLKKMEFMGLQHFWDDLWIKSSSYFFYLIKVLLKFIKIDLHTCFALFWNGMNIGNLLIWLNLCFSDLIWHRPAKHVCSFYWTRLYQSLRSEKMEFMGLWVGSTYSRVKLTWKNTIIEVGVYLYN